MTDMPPLPPVGERPMTDREAELAQFMALLQDGRPKSAIALALLQTPFAMRLLTLTIIIVTCLLGVPMDAYRLLARMI